MRMSHAAPSLPSTSWDSTEGLHGSKALLYVPQAPGNAEPLRLLGSSSARTSNSMETTHRQRGWPWNTFASPSHMHGWNTSQEDHLSQTFSSQRGLPKTIIGTASPDFRRITGISSMGTAQSKISQIGTSVLFAVAQVGAPSAKADIPSPSTGTSRDPVVWACPSYDRVAQTAPSADVFPEDLGHRLGQGRRSGAYRVFFAVLWPPWTHSGSPLRRRWVPFPTFRSWIARIRPMLGPHQWWWTRRCTVRLTRKRQR